MTEKNQDERDASPRIMLLYADLTDPETGDEVDTRVGVFSNDWLIAESADGDQEFGRLSMEAVEVMAYNLSRSLGVKDVVERLTILDDFPQGSFEWDFALKALREQQEKISHGLVDEKLQRVLDGETVVADDEWLDQVDLPSGVTSIPNPDRVGLLDVYLVGKLDNPVIHEWRVKNGLVEPETAQSKKPKLGM